MNAERDSLNCTNGTQDNPDYTKRIKESDRTFFQELGRILTSSCLCEDCGWRGEILDCEVGVGEGDNSSHFYPICPKCGSESLEIREARR